MALGAGEAAPFAGQLLTPELAIALGQKAAGADVRLRLEVATATRTAAIELRYALALAQADLHAATASAALQRDRAELAEAAYVATQPGVFDHPLFWVLVGVAAMAGAFALARGEIVALR